MPLRHMHALTGTACNSESLGLRKFLPLFVLELCFLRDVCISLLPKCGTALNIKPERVGNGGVWQLLWSVTMTKGLPHFHRCLHKYNRLAIIHLSLQASACVNVSRDPQLVQLSVWTVHRLSARCRVMSCRAGSSESGNVSVSYVACVLFIIVNRMSFSLERRNCELPALSFLHTSLASDATDAGLLQK